MESRIFRLSQAPLSLRVLITAFLTALTVGYAVSLLQIGGRTGIRTDQTVRHYRGSETEAEVFVPQSTGTMISVAHVHSFSQPVVVGLVGFMFLFTGYSQGAKIFWPLVPFVGSLVSLISPWLIRDLSPKFVYALYASGSLMFLGFGVMTVAILHETWRGGRKGGVGV